MKASILLVFAAFAGSFSIAHGNPINLDAGLVDQYKFDGNIKDSSGYGLDLTANQPFNYVKDRFGEENKAVQITTVGPSQPAFFGTGPNLANQSSSVSFWIRKDNVTAGAWLFGLGHQIGTGGADGQDMHVAMDYGNSLRYSFFYNDLDSPTPLANDAWYNLTFTYDYGTGVRDIYINGSLDATNLAPVPFSGGTNFFLGGFAGISLDDFRFYNRALNSDEVKALARVPEAGMTALYLGMGLAGLMFARRRTSMFLKRQT